MGRYRSVAREKVMERANASSNRSMGSTTLQLPEEFKDMKFFKPSKEVHTLDVIGYVVTDPKNPEGIEPGYMWHSRRYYIHRNIGAEDSNYVCLAKTFGVKCPICEFAKQGKNTGALDRDQLTALRPKERALFCVIDKDDKEEKVQLLDVSHHLFGKMLDKELTDSDDPDVWKFFEPDSGISLRCRFAKEQFQGKDFFKCDRIDFKNRKDDYPDSIVDEVPPLDEVFIRLSYEQLEEIFVMGDASSADDSAPRERPRRGREEPEEESGSRTRRGRREEPEEEPAPRRGRTTAAEADEPPARRPSRGASTSREEPEEAPAEESRRPARGGRRAAPEPEEEPAPPARSSRRAAQVDPDPEPADEPPARKPSRTAAKDTDGGKCPNGFVFGDDCEKDDLCDSCNIWGACNAAARKRG